MLVCLSGQIFNTPSAAGPLAQSAERGADTPGSRIQQLRRGREFEPLTDQQFLFSLFQCGEICLFPLIVEKTLHSDIMVEIVFFLSGEKSRFFY